MDTKNKLLKPPIQPSEHLMYKRVDGQMPPQVQPPIPKKEKKQPEFAAPTQPFGPPFQPQPIYSKAYVGFVPPKIERLNPYAQPDQKECFDYSLPVNVSFIFCFDGVAFLKAFP
jgi:hypothetical protein